MPLYAYRFLLAVSLFGLGSTYTIAAAPITVQVALSDSTPPISFVNGGEVNGLLKEMLQALFEHTQGYQAKFRGYPWARAQWLVEHGQMDLFLTFPSASRQRYATFSEHAVFTMDYANIVYRTDSDKAAQIKSSRSFEDLRGLVFISQDSVAWEKENVPQFIQRYTVSTPAAMMHMTFQRRVGDFFIMPAEQAIYYAEQLGYGNQLSMQKVTYIPNSSVSFHVGIRKSFPEQTRLLIALENAIQSPQFQDKKRMIELKYRRLAVRGPGRHSNGFPSPDPKHPGYHTAAVSLTDQ